MRITFTFIFILIVSSLSAQDYSCFMPQSVQYFINSGGYLRAMRIDSIRNTSVSTTYSPFRTYRFGEDINGNPTPIDKAGSSWLGKNVIATVDGTFIFDNMWDTVFIKTRANIGESWVLYDDAFATYYKAIVTGIDTMTVNNMLDSVKSIVIKAYTASGPNIADPMNGIIIKLSQHHGFAQVFDLYTFPMHKPDSQYAFGLDYYLDYSINSRSGKPSINNQTFKQVTFLNPTRQELYDYEKGDMFKYRGSSIGSSYSKDFEFVDSIADKTINGSSTSYVISTVKSESDRWGPNKGIVSRSTTTKTFDNTRLINDALLPEETSQNIVCYYYPEDTTSCLKSPAYSIGPSSIYDFGEGCGWGYRYKLKMGRISSAVCSDPHGGYGDYDYLVGSKKNGTPCGEVKLVVHEIDNSFAINIYPNPANNNLYIAFKDTNPQVYTLQLFDLTGKALITKTTNQNISIPMGALANGLYLLHIVNEAGDNRYEKIVVQH